MEGEGTVSARAFWATVVAAVGCAAVAGVADAFMVGVTVLHRWLHLAIPLELASLFALGCLASSLCGTRGQLLALAAVCAGGLADCLINGLVSGGGIDFGFAAAVSAAWLAGIATKSMRHGCRSLKHLVRKI